MEIPIAAIMNAVIREPIWLLFPLILDIYNIGVKKEDGEKITGGPKKKN